MKKTLITLTLILTLSLTGCSSGVAQEEYDALLLENELLRQELAAYTGEVYTPTPSTEDETAPSDSIADAIKLEVVEHIGDYWYNTYLIIENTSEYIVEGAFSVLWFDNSGNVIGSENVQTTALGPGESHCKWLGQERQPFSPTRIEASIVSVGIADRWLGTVANVNFKDHKSNDGVIIEATNNDNYSVQFIKADVLFYKNGKVVDHGDEYITDHEDELKPSQTMTVEVECSEAFDSYRIFYEGRY